MIIKKVDEDQRLVYAEVYAPNVPDSQNEFMRSEAIVKMAHSFMRNMRLKNVDSNHSLEANGSYVAESFLARESDPVFIPGSWVVAIKVLNDDEWADVKSDKYNGISLYGTAIGSEPVVLEFEVPDVITGATQKTGGHSHTFSISLDESGKISSGITDFVEGHSHRIVRGTLTEDSNGHAHKFSFLEKFINVSQNATS